MRRASSSLRGEIRQQKPICPPQTRSPHSDLSHPPLEIWCAEKVQHYFSSVWQFSGCVGPSPSTVRPSAASGPRVRRHNWFSPIAHGPRAGHLSVQCFTLHHPKQGRRGLFFSGGGHHFFQAFSTPQVRYVFLSMTLCFLYRSSADSSKQRLEGFCATTGTFLLPTERSDRGNTSVGHRTRVLQPLLPCSKKERRPKTHSGSAASEPFPLQREIQNADDENNHVSDSRRGLVCYYRPKGRSKGCILSHPGRPAIQEVPSVCLWREGLPIQGPCLGPENVHEVHGCCTGPLEVPGHSCSELLRRLAHSGPFQGVSEPSQRYHSPPHSFSWPQNERQEKCSLPLSANCVFGVSLGFRSDAGPFGSCLDIQFYSMSGPFQARPSCLSEYLPQVARPHGSGLPCVAPRVASPEAVPLVDERAEIIPHDTSHLPN